MKKKNLIMKNLIVLCAITATIWYADLSAGSTHREKLANQTLTIDDESVQNLGYDTIICFGYSPYVVDMPSNNTYTPTIGASAASITINTTTVAYPNSADVTLPSGGVVEVEWSDANTITITDITIVH